MSLPSRDQLIDMDYRMGNVEFLFNASEALRDAKEFLGFNNTMDILDFISPGDTKKNNDDGGGLNSEQNYIDQQELNDALKEFRNNLFSYADPKTILLICLYVPIFITALVGNILVLMVVLPNRHMRNVTNCFIVNLAVADLLVTLICMPMAIGQSIHKLWIYGEFMCKLTTYMQGVSVLASVFTLMVLSVDRFLAIRHPMTFRSYSTFRYAICILTCLWLLATATMIPLVLVRQIHTIQLTHHVEPLHICTEIWKHPHGRRIYDSFLFVFMFIMPGCFITASYSLIGCKLWTEKQQIHRRDSQAGREQTEKVMSGRRRVARMLAALAVAFGCCWLPYHLHSLYLDFSKLHDVTAIEALPFTILLGHANSAFNPILYCFMNKSFRKTTARLLHIRTKKKKRTSKKDPVNVVVRYQVTNTSRPTCNTILQRPLLRTGSSSSNATCSRSTASSRLSRSSRSSPNSFRSNGSITRRFERRDPCIGTFYAAIPVSDRIRQQEMYPSKQMKVQHNTKDELHDPCNKSLQLESEAARKKREMFNYTISIPTTIQEETSRSSRSLSPMIEKHSVTFVDHPVVHFEETRQLPAKVVNSVLKGQAGRYRDGDYQDPKSLDEIAVQIHVHSGNVPVIMYEAME